MPARIYAFWCRAPGRGNVGDALTPWLIERIAGQCATFASPELPVAKYLVSGSIAAYASEWCTVWGAGIMSRHDRLSPRATFVAVRGPLTRARALDCGVACPDVYGDPALLAPLLYRPRDGGRRGIGLVPHLADRHRFDPDAVGARGLRLIDVQWRVEAFIDAVASCEAVGSTSLHGLILSHAYGVPAAWLRFAPLPSGDDSKFHDYYLSLGVEPPDPVWITPDRLDPDVVAQRATLPPSSLDVGRLWELCPFGLP